MKIRLIIERYPDPIQCKSDDSSFKPYVRTVDIYVTDNLIDTEHEHVIGVEVGANEWGD